MRQHPVPSRVAWALGALAIALSVAPAPEAQAAPSGQAPAISHLCGGVGAGAMKALQAKAPNYDMGFWMVKGPKGEYLADVPVRVSQAGRTIAEFTAGGPLCYMQAPVGTYSIHAKHDGVERVATIKTGQKDVYLRW